MKKGINNSIYSQMQRMAALTAAMVLSGRPGRAKKFLNAAENLFLNGNYQTRNAVSNVYVYNLSGMLEMHHGDIQTLFPHNLKAEYVKQINAF